VEKQTKKLTVERQTKQLVHFLKINNNRKTFCLKKLYFFILPFKYPSSSMTKMFQEMLENIWNSRFKQNITYTHNTVLKHKTFSSFPKHEYIHTPRSSTHFDQIKSSAHVSWLRSSRMEVGLVFCRYRLGFERLL